jgi:hypothetical protein
MLSSPSVFGMFASMFWIPCVYMFLFMFVFVLAARFYDAYWPLHVVLVLWPTNCSAPLGAH